MNKFLKALPEAMVDLIGLAGAGLISYGSWCIFRPAGFIVAGAFMVFGAFLTARAG